MKKFVACLLLFQPFFAFTQQSAADVLHAEKRFAAYAVARGTKGLLPSLCR